MGAMLYLHTRLTCSARASCGGGMLCGTKERLSKCQGKRFLPYLRWSCQEIGVAQVSISAGLFKEGQRLAMSDDVPHTCIVRESHHPCKRFNRLTIFPFACERRYNSEKV